MQNISNIREDIHNIDEILLELQTRDKSDPMLEKLIETMTHLKNSISYLTDLIQIEKKEYETGMKISIRKKDLNNCKIDVKINEKDKCLTYFFNNQRLVSMYSDLMESNKCQRIFDYTKSIDIYYGIDRSYLSYEKICLFIETVNNDIFLYSYRKKNNNCLFAAFISLFNKNSCFNDCCEKKYKNNVVSFENNDIIFDNCFRISGLYINKVGDFNSHYQSKHPLNYYINFGINNSVEIKNIQILKWD